MSYHYKPTERTYKSLIALRELKWGIMQLAKLFNLSSRTIIRYLKIGYRLKNGEYVRKSIPKYKNLRSKKYIYFIKETDSYFVKIGEAENISKRLKALQVANPRKLILFGSVLWEHRKEREFHKKYSKYHIKGEWFKFDDKSLKRLKDEFIQGGLL